MIENAFFIRAFTFRSPKNPQNRGVGKRKKYQYSIANNQSEHIGLLFHSGTKAPTSHTTRHMIFIKNRQSEQY